MLCYVSVQCYRRQSYGSDFSIGLIDQVAVFSDFIRLFELLGLGFTPYGSNAFYILELIPKIILKTLIVNSMNNFHAFCCSYKAFDYYVM